MSVRQLDSRRAEAGGLLLTRWRTDLKMMYGVSALFGALRSFRFFSDCGLTLACSDREERTESNTQQQRQV